MMINGIWSAHQFRIQASVCDNPTVHCAPEFLAQALNICSAEIGLVDRIIARTDQDGEAMESYATDVV